MFLEKFTTAKVNPFTPNDVMSFVCKPTNENNII